MHLLGDQDFSQGLGGLGAQRAFARRISACFLVALFCLALAWPVEAPAQSASRDIEAVQRRLVELGYDSGAVDGHFGPRTSAALQAFQRDRGLPATGRPAGTTLLALFTHQPSATPADTRTPAANPPSLDAVLLKPIQVAPQAPLAGDSSHQGLVVEPALAVRPMEPRPSIHTNRSEPPAPLETMARPETRDLWFNWAAAALATIGVIVLLPAVRLRQTRRDATSDTLRQPIRSVDQATATTVRRGHVFGVDVRVGSV